MRGIPWYVTLLLLLSIAVVNLSTLGNQEPVAQITVSSDRDADPVEHIFDASASFDSDGRIERYAWDFGDGSGSQHVMAKHAYDSQGRYVVTLVVVDDLGDSDMATRVVHVTDSSLPPAIVRAVDARDYSDPYPLGRRRSYSLLIYVLIGLAVIFTLLLLTKKGKRRVSIAKIRRVVALLRALRRGWYDFEDLHRLLPREFEELVAQIWKHKGYDTHLTGRSADGGIDVVAVRKGRRVAIQAKRYAASKAVGVRVIRENASHLILPAVSDVVVVTSSRFTSSAMEEARSLGVELVDGAELLEILNNSKIDIGRAVSAVRFLRKLCLISSLLMASSSGILIYIGWKTNTTRSVLAGVGIAALLILSFVSLLRRSASRLTPDKTEDNPLLEIVLSSTASDTEEDLPTGEVLFEGAVLHHNELLTRVEVLSAYGEPDEITNPRTCNLEGEIWHYHIPAMIFHFGTDGRMISHYP